MSERVKIYVGAREKPTISFDLNEGVELHDALRMIVNSIERRKKREKELAAERGK